MPEHRLKALTPLGESEPVVETIGAATIAEVTTTAMASLALRRGRHDEVEKAAAKIGLRLAEPGHIAAGATWSVIWTGPEQWLVEAALADHEDIVAELCAVFGAAVSLTEQTDAFARFDLTGGHLPDLLERLCSLDTRSMQAGAAARSMIEHMSCHVICRAPDHFTLLAPRSFAASFFHALKAAAKSIVSRKD